MRHRRAHSVSLALPDATDLLGKTVMSEIPAQDIQVIRYVIGDKSHDIKSAVQRHYTDGPANEIAEIAEYYVELPILCARLSQPMELLDHSRQSRSRRRAPATQARRPDDQVDRCSFLAEGHPRALHLDNRRISSRGRAATQAPQHLRHRHSRPGPLDRKASEGDSATFERLDCRHQEIPYESAMAGVLALALPEKQTRRRLAILRSPQGDPKDHGNPR